ncbi:hypothetical protein PRIC2_003256 [Phytophthora ramorum]
MMATQMKQPPESIVQMDFGAEDSGTDEATASDHLNPKSPLMDSAGDNNWMEDSAQQEDNRWEKKRRVLIRSLCSTAGNVPMDASGASASTKKMRTAKLTNSSDNTRSAASRP